MPRVGLISDTHGLLRPEAKAFLEGCDRIIHGGDIGNPDILEQLAALAPLTVVRGNNDHGDWADDLAETHLVQIDNVLIYVIHDIALLDIDPRAARVRVVVCGHSHVPSVTERGDVLYVNPGSAGPRRFKLPIAAGELEITGNAVDARIVRLGGNIAGHAKD
jgi:putative phosphoesterase